VCRPVATPVDLRSRVRQISRTQAAGDAQGPPAQGPGSKPLLLAGPTRAWHRAGGPPFGLFFLNDNCGCPILRGFRRVGTMPPAV